MIFFGQDAQKSFTLTALTLDQEVLNQLARDQSPAFIIRKSLKDAARELDALFSNNFDIKSILLQRSRWVEQALLLGWGWFQLDSGQLTLCAVGGFGREQLHPHSDVDLLILSRKSFKSPEIKAIEKFISYCWDIGLNIGHSVRTIDESVSIAKDDLSVYSNLLDCRYLDGDYEAFQELNTHIQSSESRTPQAFFEKKSEERRKRYKRYGHTEYNLEPNLKECPGGLRDIQMLALLTKKQWQHDNLETLQKNQFISEDEYRALDGAQNVLWTIRYALHNLAQKREERLHLDYQVKLASIFQCKGATLNESISLFMQVYFRAAHELRETTSILFQHFREYYQTQSALAPLALNEDAQILSSSIEIIEKQRIQNEPHRLLELFRLLAKDPELRGFTAQSTRWMKSFIQKTPFTANDLKRSLFVQLFDYPKGVAKSLRLMARFGLLSQYLPEFTPIIGQMQYDLYHVYTVDAHTLNLLDFIQDYALDQHHAIPHVAACLKEPLNFRILYLAGLFHDLSKGTGGNHSIKGSQLAIQFCHEHHLPEYETQLISWIVKEHLTFSSFARSQDLSDPNTIVDFANKLKTNDHLRYLYLFTIADVHATNPKLWTRWQQDLFAQLYQATHLFLESGGKAVALASKIEQTKQEALHFLNELEPDIVQEIWRDLGDDYFYLESSDSIAWHTRERLKHRHSEPPLVALRNLSQGGTEVFVYTEDRAHLFALMAAAFEKLQLTIVQARILTASTGFCFNTFVILESSGFPIHSPYRLNEVQKKLQAQFRSFSEDPYKALLPAITYHRINRHLHLFKDQVKVSFSNTGNHHTVLMVQAPDFPGLLARIGEVFIACDCFVHGAKINTLDKRVEDIFFISNRQNNQPIQDESALLLMKSLILDKLTQF